MEREASFLRCSKLSCYAEFNRMVQALSIHSKGESCNNLRPPLKGTSAEYNFYRTLSIMLHQVLSNTDTSGQRQELKMIYQWFTLNKPLAPQRVKPSARKPQLVFSSKRSVLLSPRPQTAPASLGYYTSHNTPTCPPSTPALTTFVSSFMVRTIKSPQEGPRPATQPLPERGNRTELELHQQETAILPIRNQNHSSTASTSSRHDMSTIGLTSGTIYANASSVAAQMTLDRVLSQWVRRGPAGRNYLDKETVSQSLLQDQTSGTHASLLSPSTARRSKSMTTLETISETEFEDTATIVDEQMIKTAIEESKDEMKHILRQGSEKSRGIHNIDDDLSDKNGCKLPATKQTEKEIQIEPPRVTIEERNERRLLNRFHHHDNQGSAVKTLSTGSRKVCQVQVFSLNLPAASINTRTKSRNRCPKKLVPIVAGFNQQHYRPRTVS